MKRTTGILGAALVCGAAAIALGAASAQGQGGPVFEVTVTNLTAGQILSPLLLATHRTDVSLFEPGQPASPELALLAEEGDNSALASLLGGTPGVADVATGAGLLMPGQSETLLVQGHGNARSLSLAAMLVSTNDAFAALEGVVLPNGRTAEFYAMAWDAGSEYDSESCAFVPGPPCGSGGAHDPTPAEGFVHVDSGVHGVGDLAPADHDWRGPVARVVVRHLH